MIVRRMKRVACAAALLALCLTSNVGAADDPLPSWNEGAAKQAIIDFVTRVTQEGGADYVAPEERIATFDNDGTLWVEQPMYTQFMFAIDRVKTEANQHPEWKDTEPFKSVLARRYEGRRGHGREGDAGNRRRHAFRHDHGGL